MIPTTLGELAETVNGELHGPAETVVTSASIDTRSLEPGALFVALAGEHVDGHDYVAAAIAAGAAGALVERPVAEPSVLVPDAVSALARLAHANCVRLTAPVIGITGSSGKTTTKDLTAFVLSGLGATVAPVGSFNNEIGLPLTVLRADADTRYLVLEMSARGLGHIAALCTVAPPTVGVVLNVGSAHVGEFGGRDATAQAKGELVDALPADGLAVLNADDPLVAAMASRSAAPVVLVGTAPESDYRAGQLHMVDGRAHFTLVAPDGTADVELPTYGEHQVGNALAVAAVAAWAGLDLAATARALSTPAPVSRWRMEVRDTRGHVTVVNDAYNANPESMRAALRALVDIAGGRRTWAVLGAMAELGAVTDVEHERLGRLVAELGVQRLVVVGDGAGPLADTALTSGLAIDAIDWVPDVDAAVALLRGAVSRGDVVLVKASRVAGLDRVAAALLDDEEGSS